VASIVALDPLSPADHHGHQNGQRVWCFFVIFSLHVTLLSTRVMQSKYLPDDGIQWLRVKLWTPFIGQ
jgi:hypothetical protein